MSSGSQPAVVAIHVAAPETVVSGLEDMARHAEMSVVRLPLSGVRQRYELCDRLTDVFMFPHKTRGLDAAVDLLSDLAWFDNQNGYLVVVEDADSAPAHVVADLVGILPAVADRWRSQGIRFVVVLEGVSHRSIALESLQSANAGLEKAGELTWVQDTHPVDVVDHWSV